MYFDLSNLMKAATKSPKKVRTLSSSALFAIPDITERSKRIESRRIDTTPYKILDAPGMVDDYYLNLLDWTSSRISIGLGETVYCYNTSSKEVHEAFSCKNGYISSVKGFEDRLVIGDSSGNVNFYDFHKQEVTECRKNHNTRVCSIATSDRIVSTGEKSGKICNIDMRSEATTSFIGHTQEVCGLKWSPSSEYLASGGNDNTVRIWKMGSPISRQLKGHESAVKALDWCPWKTDVLATGGGTKDKTIKFWDVQSGKAVKSVQVESQVTTLTFINKYKEMITSHGFHENDLKLWKCAGMKKITSFGAHESRILHTALSPDQCTIVSLGADESLKFWKILDDSSKDTKRDSIGLR